MGFNLKQKADGSTQFVGNRADVPFQMRSTGAGYGGVVDTMSATITVAAEGSNSIAVSIQLTDMNGNELRERRTLFAYLSADANGDAIYGTTLGGTVGIGTDGLAIELVSKKCWLLTSESDGDIDMVFGDTDNEAAAYLVLVMPDGRLVVSGAIDLA